MIPNYLSAMWTAIAPLMGNHLWQSTIFAITAGLLTLLLRKNHARTRYWLWLAASVKFLIPFSLLVGMGGHLAWSRGSAGTNAGLYFVMEEIIQPFAQPTMPVLSRATPSTAFPGLPHLLAALLAAVWLCGFLVVIFVWYMRWRRISAAIREALPLREGREVEALRRLERVGGMRMRIEMLLSRTSLEPGIFGIVRPVLVWPQGLSERLEDAHLEAILAHELWHVRRRDNLAATIHMVVEASFWFYPLVWWLGARLVEERERACDEQVLESGSNRQVYAESILKICEFCVGSPLDFVSGVTGADLKKRIVHIMTEGAMRKLDFSRKLLLGAVGLAAVVVPVAFGLLHAAQTRTASQTLNEANVYEIVSIKENKTGTRQVWLRFLPTGLTATNVKVRTLIRFAYDVEDDRLLAEPSWLDANGYDIEAKLDSSVSEALAELSEDQRALEGRRMLQVLLAERFKLIVHRETKELPVYSLVIASTGPKVQDAKPGDTYPNGFVFDGHPAGHGIWLEGNKLMGQKIMGQGVPMSTLAHTLSPVLRHTIVDKTGLTGNFDFTLQWTPGEGQTAILAAIQEQLGLKLESQAAPVEILVIDHVEKPSEY